VEKIMEIDEHIGCAMSGLTADARTLVEHGRVETQVGFVISHSLSLSLSLCPILLLT
jgi:20S proteasome subunit alpha 5